MAAHSCLGEYPRGIEFFAGTTAVAQARWNGTGAFVVERVIRGDARAGDSIAFAEPPDDCVARLQTAKLYLVTRNCNREGCRIRWAGDDHAPRLLQYLDGAHRETHETVLAKATAWCAGELTLGDFTRWIESVEVEPRGERDDAFLQALVDELGSLAFDVSRLSPGQNIDKELRELMKLAVAFPAGTQAAFDQKVEDSGDNDAPLRDEFEAPLFRALRAAREAARKRSPKIVG